MKKYTKQILDLVKSAIFNVTIEPCFFLFAMNYGFYIVVARTLYINKICAVNMNISKNICDEIQNHKDIQVEVQKYASELSAYNEIIQAIPPCIYALFAGPWSDRHGRKPLMICSLFGYFLCNGVFYVNWYWFYELKAEYLLFECLQDLTGGSAIWRIAAYSYLSDVSEPEMRTKRIAFCDGMFLLGFYIGNMLGGPVQHNLGYGYNFGFGMICSILAIAWCVFYVKDVQELRDARLQKELGLNLSNDKISDIRRVSSHKVVNELQEPKKNETGMRNKILSFFKISSASEGFITVFKKRDGYKRLCIILTIIAMTLDSFSGKGKWQSLMLYFRKVLSWTITQYSSFMSSLGLIGAISNYILVPLLSRKFLIHDSTIAIIDTTTSVISNLIQAFVRNGMDWMIYLGVFISILDYASSTMFRSLISKNVQANEVGKVFSVVGIFETLIPFGTAPLFGFLYKSTVAFQPNAFLFLVVGIKGVVLVLMIIVRWKEDVNDPSINDECE